MRRHMSMDELANDVLSQAASAAQTKVASAPAVPSLEQLGVLAQNLVKLAQEIRQVKLDTLTYDDIALVAEARRAQR